MNSSVRPSRRGRRLATPCVAALVLALIALPVVSADGPRRVGKVPVPGAADRRPTTIG